MAANINVSATVIPEFAKPPLTTLAALPLKILFRFMSQV
jgi:hypothetical protein